MITKEKILAAIDRRVEEENKPFNARLGERRIEDPHNPGQYIVASAQLRDDPLGRLYARRQIREWQYQAGRHVQEGFEAASVGSVQGIDYAKPMVDTSGGGDSGLTFHQMNAFKRLRRAHNCLGKTGFLLVQDVLADRRTFAQIAAARNVIGGKHATEYLGRRFREALDNLAEEFGFRGQAPPAINKAA